VQRHETDPVALTFGLIFLGIATAWLMVTAGGADITGLRYFFPVLLLGAGAAGIVANVLKRPARVPEEVVDTSEGQS
jgi:hypothetical protein